MLPTADARSTLCSRPVTGVATRSAKTGPLGRCRRTGRSEGYYEFRRTPPGIGRAILGNAFLVHVSFPPGPAERGIRLVLRPDRRRARRRHRHRALPGARPDHLDEALTGGDVRAVPGPGPGGWRGPRPDRREGPPPGAAGRPAPPPAAPAPPRAAGGGVAPAAPPRGVRVGGEVAGGRPAVERAAAGARLVQRHEL